MATTETGRKRSSLKDIKSRLFQCALCNGQIVDRKEMPCGHNFCMKCFQDKNKRSNVDNSEVCPKCHSRSRLPSDRGWKLHSPRGVCPMPGGGFAKVENVDGIVKTYSMEGNSFNAESGFKARQKLDSGKFSCPWDVTISDDGYFFITDSTSFVNVYNPEGKFKRQFFTIAPDGSFSNAKDGDSALCGIALNLEDNLVIGEINTKYISVCRKNGSHMHSFNVDVKPNFLTVTPKGDIVISSCQVGHAEIVDENGNHKCKITAPPGVTSWCPTGVACTSKGELFICNRLGDVGIYRFSPEGKYIGLVTKNVITPWGLAISKGDKFLFVSDERDYSTFRLK